MNKIILAALLLLAGCGPKPDTAMKVSSPTIGDEAVAKKDKGDGRFRIERVGVVYDDLAYESKRGIYVIIDTKTGKEYFGMSGIGITETGNHNCGKNCNRDDER
jgi:hypothetical protein